MRTQQDARDKAVTVATVSSMASTLLAIQGTFKDATLCAYDKLVYLSLIMNALPSTFTARVTLRQIASDCYLSLRSVSSSLRRLRQRGFLSVYRTGRASVYELHLNELCWGEFFADKTEAHA